VAWWRTLPTDAEAAYDATVRLSASDIAPSLTWGTSPEDVVPITGRVPDPDSFADGFPHDAFRRLRREAPIYWHPQAHERGGQGFFVVSKYEDVRYVGRTPGIYSSVPGITIVESKTDFEAGQSSMLQMDPPRHARYRKLVSGGFTPRRINALEPMIRELANEILDEAEAKGGVDYVTDIAAELPLRVIARFLGVPNEERATLFSASNRLLGFEDKEYGTTEEDGRTAAMDLAMMAYRIAESRKAEPRDDIVTILQNAEVDGERLSEVDFIAFEKRLMPRFGKFRHRTVRQ